MSLFKERMTRYVGEVNEALEQYLPDEDCAQKSVIGAMRYSLMNGGKRIRPVILLEFCHALGGDMKAALPFACAIEMIHTYSLIHDDLPCMDDDDMRRGKPSCHKAFGEDIALLAGDGLLTLAFRIILADSVSERISPARVLAAAAELAEAAGYRGMIGGQVMDLENENRGAGLEVLQKMDELKTGALIRAAAKIGCIISGKNNEFGAAADVYAQSIGIAFQIMDDVLDETAESGELGKPAGSDAQRGKSTYVSLLGVLKALEFAEEFTRKAKESLAGTIENSEGLRELADILSARKK